MKEGCWSFISHGNQATSGYDPKIRSRHRDNGQQRQRGEVEPHLRKKRKGLRLSSAADVEGGSRCREHSVTKRKSKVVLFMISVP